MAIPVLGVRNYVLLSLSPLSGTAHTGLATGAGDGPARASRVVLDPDQKYMCEQFPTARLACLIHAANVHSEPGSNPSIGVCINLASRGRGRPGSLAYEPFEKV